MYSMLTKVIFYLNVVNILPLDILWVHREKEGLYSR